MNNFVYFLLEISLGGTVTLHDITNKWSSSLCDKALSMSADNKSTIYVYQLFMLRPTSSKKLFIFKQGHLIGKYE